MENLKIVGWTDFECEYPTIKVEPNDMRAVINLIQDEIEVNGYSFSGEEHQCMPTGVPVFSNGTCFRASMRCWGSIMASIYCGQDNEELSYMDFYMSLGDDAIMPEQKEINVEPMDTESYLGYTTNEDMEIISQSLAFGMPFMTTDKVLQKLTKNFEKEFGDFDDFDDEFEDDSCDEENE
ncbi:MAG: hypothetical protein IJW82_06155 [Clostridia bacterium]|nr:hypothetical protein [Clostridia bacterium]